ncbi:hypothetical protein ACJX0J_007334, partial [Zea mays]
VMCMVLFDGYIGHSASLGSVRVIWFNFCIDPSIKFGPYAPETIPADINFS